MEEPAEVRPARAGWANRGGPTGRLFGPRPHAGRGLCVVLRHEIEALFSQEVAKMDKRFTMPPRSGDANRWERA